MTILNSVNEFSITSSLVKALYLVSLIKVKVAQLCPTLCGYTVHGILQARVLEWIAYPFSSRSAQLRNQTGSPALQADALPAERSGKPTISYRRHLMLMLAVWYLILDVPDRTWGHCGIFMQYCPA